MSLNETLKIKENQIILPDQIILGSENLKKDKKKLHIDSKNFNDAIGGGFSPGTKYLIFGANKTGKTQLCHQICIQGYKFFSRIVKEQNIKFIFYFDTENTFRPERLRELLNSSDPKINSVFKSILVSKIMSTSALNLALKDFDTLAKKVEGGLLIIDSINNHFRSDLGNKKISFNESKNVFLSILNKINELTETYNLITIVTSQIAANFSKKGNIKEIPVGNQFLNHFFSEYIYLSKKDSETNHVQLVNSLHYPEKKLLYKITSKGIQDYKI